MGRRGEGGRGRRRGGRGCVGRDVLVERPGFVPTPTGGHPTARGTRAPGSSLPPFKRTPHAAGRAPQPRRLTSSITIYRRQAGLAEPCRPRRTSPVLAGPAARLESTRRPPARRTRRECPSSAASATTAGGRASSSTCAPGPRRAMPSTQVSGPKKGWGAGGGGGWVGRVRPRTGRRALPSPSAGPRPPIETPVSSSCACAIPSHRRPCASPLDGGLIRHPHPLTHPPHPHRTPPPSSPQPHSPRFPQAASRSGSGPGRRPGHPPTSGARTAIRPSTPGRR
jgi:hypothetical protein